MKIRIEIEITNHEARTLEREVTDLLRENEEKLHAMLEGERRVFIRERQVVGFMEIVP